MCKCTRSDLYLLKWALNKAGQLGRYGRYYVNGNEVVYRPEDDLENIAERDNKE